MRLLFFISAFLVLGLSYTSSAQLNRSIPSEKPKLIVQVVVSQMRFDYLNRYWESLAIMDLNYLLTKGLTAEMPVTTTCSPRHTLGWPPLPPGANPSVHGIIPTSGITAIQETRLKPPPTKRLTRLGVVFSGG